MSFASPGYLALLALAPLAAVAYLSLARWRRRAGERFAPDRGSGALDTGASAHRREVRALLVVAAVALLAVALARPQFGEERVVVEQDGADVMIVLDVSRSMFAADVEPSRLAQSQRDTLALLDRLRNHRVGLVIFAGNALLRAPLTTDISPLRSLVDSAANDSVLLMPGSDLGNAIRTAAAVLSAEETESKAIVLISDGEDHDGGAVAAAQTAARSGILLFATGVGTDSGAPVPAIDPETGLPAAGDPAQDVPIITRRNEALLRQIAAASPRGDYVASGELGGLAGRIDRLERTTFASEQQRLPVERFQWVVLAALALLLLEMLLPERRGGGWPLVRLRRATPQAGALVALVALAIVGASCASTAGDLIADGNEAYERGDYEAALEAYRRASVAAPERPEPRYNAGLALHRLGRFEDAVQETARALPIEDALEAARAHYNLGNHYVRLGRLPEAFVSYRQALLLDPDDTDAKYNLELVLALMEEPNVEGSPMPGETDAGEGRQGDQEGAGEGMAGETEAVQRSLEEALAGIDDEFTVDEALRALELAQALNRLLPLVDQRNGAGPSDGPDY